MIKIPKNENVWVQYIQDDKVTHIITSTKMRDIYYLYKIDDNKLVKTKHKSSNPVDLEKWIYQ
jgi:hypothetical protein